MYVLHRRILDYIPSGQVIDFPRDVFSKIVRSEKLYGVPLTGYRCAIDSPERYAEAKAAVLEHRYQLSR